MPTTPRSSSHRPGRPPVDSTARTVRLTLRVSERQFDDLHQRARRERVTVPELIRRTLAPVTRADNVKP